jgi:hypothetical protein
MLWFGSASGLAFIWALMTDRYACGMAVVIAVIGFSVYMFVEGGLKVPFDGRPAHPQVVTASRLTWICACLLVASGCTERPEDGRATTNAVRPSASSKKTDEARNEAMDKAGASPTEADGRPGAK